MRAAGGAKRRSACVRAANALGGARDASGALAFVRHFGRASAAAPPVVTRAATYLAAPAKKTGAATPRAQCRPPRRRPRCRWTLTTTSTCSTTSSVPCARASTCGRARRGAACGGALTGYPPLTAPEPARRAPMRACLLHRVPLPGVRRRDADAQLLPRVRQPFCARPPQGGVAAGQDPRLEGRAAAAVHGRVRTRQARDAVGGGSGRGAAPVARPLPPQGLGSSRPRARARRRRRQGQGQGAPPGAARGGGQRRPHAAV